MSFDYVILWIVVLFLALVTVGLILEMQVLRRKVQGVDHSTSIGIAAGSEPPALTTSDGNDDPSHDNWGDGWSLIVFVTTRCPTCREVAGSLARLLMDDASLRAFVVCGGKKADCQFLHQNLLHRITLVCDQDQVIGRRFQISGYPATVVVRGSEGRGVVRAVGHPVTVEHFYDLMSRAALSAAPDTAGVAN